MACIYHTPSLLKIRETNDERRLFREKIQEDEIEKRSFQDQMDRLDKMIRVQDEIEKRRFQNFMDKADEMEQDLKVS